MSGLTSPQHAPPQLQGHEQRDTNLLGWVPGRSRGAIGGLANTLFLGLTMIETF